MSSVKNISINIEEEILLLEALIYYKFNLEKSNVLTDDEKLTNKLLVDILKNKISNTEINFKE